MTNRAIREHDLKVWPSFFAAILTGAKRFEVRSTRDRDFGVGDILRLREWDPQAGQRMESSGYTCRALRCSVTYVMPGGRFGIDPNTAILGLGECEAGKLYGDGEEFYCDKPTEPSELPHDDAEASRG